MRLLGALRSSEDTELAESRSEQVGGNALKSLRASGSLPLSRYFCKDLLFIVAINFKLKCSVQGFMGAREMARSSNSPAKNYAAVVLLALATVLFGW
jgi:hypothetical protein